jgi:hypothetical protein
MVKKGESLAQPFFLLGSLMTIRTSSSLEVAMDDITWILHTTEFPGIVVEIICVL